MCEALGLIPTTVTTPTHKRVLNKTIDFLSLFHFSPMIFYIPDIVWELVVCTQTSESGA